MAKLKKYNLKGQEVGQCKSMKTLANAEANGQMIKDYIVALRANARQWSANTKTRSEVNHTTKKPHPQKGGAAPVRVPWQLLNIKAAVAYLDQDQNLISMLGSIKKNAKLRFASLGEKIRENKLTSSKIPTLMPQKQNHRDF